MLKAVSRRFIIVLVVMMLMMASTSAFAQDVAEPQVVSINEISPYYTEVNLVMADGKEITESIINGPSEPPAEFETERQASIMELPREGTIANFPSFKWVFGCSAVSGAMIAGWYDRNGKPNMYTGPTAGGVMPLTDTSWPTWSDGYETYPNNPLIASKNGVDGRTTKGSINDYWIKYGSTAADPYVGHWTQHTWGTAIGDYMKTSQSAYSNTDGSSSFYNWTSSPDPLTCADMVKNNIHTRDATYGRKLFYEKRGYTVTTCYSQKTDNNGGGFTLAKFKAEIDANHPVFINLAGHSIVGYGYNGSTIYIRDTWDSNTSHTYTMPWGGSYSGMTMQSVSIVKLGPAVIPNPIKPAGGLTDKTPTYTWSKVKNATDYRFRVYKVGVSTPKFTQTMPASKCGATSCSKTPGTTYLLALGKYRWQVSAKVGGVWKPYSDFKYFSIK